MCLCQKYQDGTENLTRSSVQLLTGIQYLESANFILVVPAPDKSGERRTGRSSGGKKKKLNYAFLKPQTVETKEECRPASAIRKGN